jgi:hypothetical protein
LATKLWNTPKSRSVGLFTDLRLFYEALEIANEQKEITDELLEDELPQRLQGLLFVEKQSSRTARDLIRELKSFQWIEPVSSNSSHRKQSDLITYRLTEQGRHMFNLYQNGKGREFLRSLTTEMQKLYTIPAWFVYRLWQINPTRQGEVVIPSPPRDWNPKSRKWEDDTWTTDLSIQTKRALSIIQEVCPGSLPIDSANWEKLVKIAWHRLSNLRPKTTSNDTSLYKDGETVTYTPRRRLADAMREAAIKYLFGNSGPNTHREDFGVTKPPLAPRTYMGWCPRLETLELIFYTDAHPLLPGRLIFPTSVFRESASLDRFERVGQVTEPGGKSLWLHRPKWDFLREEYLNILSSEYQRVSIRVGSLYVSLLDVRDEVCRQIRVSAACFDEYLEEALRESVLPGSILSISVETDIREDQRSAPKLYRRPIWINGTPHSLIAITEPRHVR